MRTILSLGASLLLVGPSTLTGQTDNAGFITRLGSDTIAVERFTRTSNKLEGDLLVRSPRTRVAHYVATLGPDGTVTRFELSSRFPGNPTATPMGGVATYAGDTAACSFTWVTAAGR
jgi:hypothetical protein